jgi:NAD(P)-dependent dehydrogenase (short-subunit alcohol dehydrogenase family)
MGLLEAHADLAGKVAVVIGGAAGIGRTVTLALANAGIDVAICDIDEDAARTTVADVEALGRRIFSMHVDVADDDALDRFYDRVAAECDRVDIVVNVAGGVRRTLFLDTAREQNVADIRRNFGYVIDSFRRAVPLIRRGARGGSIINFTTIEAHRGAPGFSVYAAAKAATTSFSRTMAVELAAERIRVNTIAPDTTPSRGSFNALNPEDWAKFDSLSEEASMQAYKMYIPQKEPPSEEDLANSVLFLASDLSRAITGTALHVDGGTMAASGFIEWPFGDGFLPAPSAGTLRHLFDGGKEAVPAHSRAAPFTVRPDK